MFFRICLLEIEVGENFNFEVVRTGLKRRTNKMAKIEMRKMNGVETECLNLDFPVGENQPNVRKDVMLLQAMFVLVKAYEPGNPFSRAIQKKDLQPVGADFNQKTMNLINTYQKARARVLLKLDGIVEPAKYSGRNIDTIGHHYRVMTITALDIDCATAMIGLSIFLGQHGGGGGGGTGFGSHVQAIKYQYPYIF